MDRIFERILFEITIGIFGYAASNYIGVNISEFMKRKLHKQCIYTKVKFFLNSQNEHELITAVIKVLGLNDLFEFNPYKKVLEKQLAL